MEKRIKMLIITVLLTIEIMAVFLTWKSFTDRATNLEEVKIKDSVQVNTKDSLAIMLNNGDGNYTQSSNNTFPISGYLYNSEKSGCIDSSGAKIENALTYNQTENKAVVKTDRTSNCYIYFDKKEKPSAFTFYIGGLSNPATVSSTNTTVYLNWTDDYITHYCINTENNASTCTWVGSNSQKTINTNYTLIGGDGTKTLYAFLKDTANNISDSVSDTITLQSLNAGQKLVQSKPANLNTTLEGGLYRYQGTADVVKNNYICFGTSDKATCTGDHDKYMYRIIGINSSGQFKLIKKEALNTAYKWHNVNNANITWNNSALYKGLNGISGGVYSNLFIGNTTYIPNDTWNNKIADTIWKYGDNTDVNKTASALYTVENGWSTTVNAKIGLMYTHDYAYALKSSGENCSPSANWSECKISWLYLLNSGNDSNPPHTSAEWRMSRYGYEYGFSNAWSISNDGLRNGPDVIVDCSVRPVFFLEANTIISGEGTLTSPYVITN